MKQENQPASYLVSVTWGKSNNYSPASNEPFVWDGSLEVANGIVHYLDQLHYRFFLWGQAVEVPERIYDRNWHALLKPAGPDLTWISSVKPGDPGGLEGIRFSLRGDAATVVTLAMAPIKIQFALGELIDHEYLRYHAGGKYSGVPVDVFLGVDARRRVSRKMFLKELAAQQRPGWVVMPDDFSGAQGLTVHSMYGARVAPASTARAIFPVENHVKGRQGDCLVKVQLMAMLDSTQSSRWMDVVINVGKKTHTLHHMFTTRILLPKLEDIYLTVPWSMLEHEGNELTIRNLDGQCPFVIHRVYVGAERPSHREALQTLPPLPAQPTLWVGYDTNLLTPQNGEMDSFIQMMHEEELGNHILFRERGAEGSAEDWKRWAAKLVEYNFHATTCSASMESERILAANAGSRYLGVHTHEISNLIYGWGDSEPLAERAKRTLPECQAFYLKRMAKSKMIGQAMPLQHLDYAAGVDLVITEIPASHSSLCLASSRGAARAYEKKFWGVHIANHLPRCPVDEETRRRNFILLNQCWLYGARLIYDEECALYYNHDTSYSFSDAIPFERRRQYQSLYHYGSVIDLGEPRVRIGFLHGNYDCLVGGGQAAPYIEPTKLWGMIGPETKSWEFGTPERGWELLGVFMPGVWLYPVKQDPRAIRQFFSGTPHGQVDLVPISVDSRKLGGYELLVLPGWNTMTGDIYRNLLDYVRNGGHLVLCAAQCTEHITRDFLLEKQDFRFFRNGDLRELAGVRLGAPEGVVNAVRFPDNGINACPGLPGLKTELCGAEVLASDQAGRPVLIENKVGAGRVWMLTVGDYWGHPALDEFRRELGIRLVAAHPQPLHLSGQSEDVDVHCFQTVDAQRVVMLNTDWTTPGNSKSVTLHTPAAEIPLQVREGRLTQMLLQHDLAVVFETLPVIVDDLRGEQHGATFRASGAGQSEIRICTPRKLNAIRANGRECKHRNGLFVLDFGPTWSTQNVEVGYA